jgi:hypothetical protein
MGRRTDFDQFKRVVAERSRGIADRAWHVVSDAAADPAPGAPAWLSWVVARLPEGAREALRAALGDRERLQKARQAAEQIRREREDLRHREAAIDAARGDLDRARAALEAARFELAARESEAERLLARARRAAAEAAVERRVPVADIVTDPEARPRPLRGVARLAANIKRFGQLQPMVVTPDGDGWRLVTGYRRLAALKRAGATHALVRVVRDLDPATAAALYVAENCLVEGVSPNAVRHLAARLGDAPAFAQVLALVQADDEAVSEDVYLEDMAEDARHHLAEGAAWVATLRPHWAELEPADRDALEKLVTYFARVAARLKK